MRPEKITKTCDQCGANFKIPPCRDWREHRCSKECKKAFAAQVLSDSVFDRVRNCEACDAVFIPRQTQIDAGGGRFCSNICGIKSIQHLMHAPHVKAKRVEGIKRSIAEGRTTYKSGPENPCWTGGPAASYERAKPKIAEWTRKYRKANPEKVREFSQTRKNKKTGRLPKGTVKRLLELQRNKCAICKCSLKNGYHVDHIEPIARGGKHEKTNIQLLCPTCNVRKSTKDPIDYMQSRGFLL